MLLEEVIRMEVFSNAGILALETVEMVDLAGVGSLLHESAIRPNLIWSCPFRAGPRQGGERVDLKTVTPVQRLLRDANQSYFATDSLNFRRSYREVPVMRVASEPERSEDLS